MIQRSEARVRNLSVEDLGLEVPGAGSREESAVSLAGGAATVEPEPLPPGHPLLGEVEELIDRYGGVILFGPPGTSKSYFAQRLAITIAGNSARMKSIQFHSSYQYEDFVEGPTIAGGEIIPRPKHLVEMAEEAQGSPGLKFVIVIDELSRGDAARIFGEALTYVEQTKRGQSFSLASGTEFTIPANLIFIATMNPHDRGVDEVDAAFERRFAKVPMDPSVEILAEFLEQAGMEQSRRRRVEAFFRFANEQARSNPYATLGHTYFLDVSSEEDLRRLWRHQLRFLFERAYQLDDQGGEEIEDSWQQIFDQVDDDGEGGGDEAGEPVIA